MTSSRYRPAGGLTLALSLVALIAGCGGGEETDETAPVVVDTTPPSVTTREPASGATGVATSTSVRATFNEAMAPGSLTATTFTLRRGSTNVAGAVSYSGNVATFTPTASLAVNSVYTATVTTGATDVAGNALASEVSWSFTTGATASNRAPTIGGTPPATVMVGNTYSFTPTANDPDGDPLTFSLTGTLPSSIGFNTSTGRLNGTPTAAQVGTYSNLRITVSDGRGGTASLPTFSIGVVQTATGSVTLLWTAPTQNADGSPLTDLAGYRISYGTTTGGPYPNTVTVANAGVTSHMISQLVPGTYFFVARAYDTSGNESQNSNQTTKVVN